MTAFCLPTLYLSLPELVPFRWPAGWRKVSDADSERWAPFNCVVGEDLEPAVAAALSKRGFTILSLKNAPATTIADPRWPQVQTGPGGNVDAGPTGNPWIDSNGFAIQAARALTPDKPVWLTEDPPADRVARAAETQLAVCDAAAYGGHWLPRADSNAWKEIAAAQRFFMQHRAWNGYRPIGRLAVVSDFKGEHHDITLELLNLLARLYVPFEVVPKVKAASSESKLPMVIDVDHQDAGVDLWELSNQIRDKLGRRSDVVRLWNGNSLYYFYTAAPDGRSDLLQFINYAAREPGDAVTAGVTSTYSAARIYTLDKPNGAPIALRKAREGVEIDLPPFAVYAAIELIK